MLMDLCTLRPLCRSTMIHNISFLVIQSFAFPRLPTVALKCAQQFQPSMCRHYATRGASPLVSATQLKESINSNTPPIILDCTWFMPNIPRNAVAEFKKARIPGARFFDLDEVADKSSPYPHMLPNAHDFAEAVGLCLCDAF